jgi:hypothetical protein
MSADPLFVVRRVTDTTLKEIGVRILGITENQEDGQARCFLFQISLEEYHDQDRRLDLDAYAVSNEKGATAYGCLTSYKQSESRLILNFTKDSTKVFGLSSPVVLSLALDDQNLELLRRGLREIVGTP